MYIHIYIIIYVYIKAVQYPYTRVEQARELRRNFVNLFRL